MTANTLQATVTCLETALDAIADAVVWIKNDGAIEGCNLAFAHLVDRQQDEVVGNRLFAVLPLMQRGKFITPGCYPDERVRAGHYTPGEYEFQRQGDRLTLEVSGRLAVVDETTRSAVLILRDVTRMRSALMQEQEEREKSLSLLQATLEATADAVLVVGRDRSVPVYNQKFLQLWGMPEELLQAGREEERLQFLANQTTDPEGFIGRIWELFRDRPSEVTLDFLEFKDGRIIERYSQPQMQGCQITGRVWCFRDITERKRMEEALRRSEIKYRNLFANSQVGIFRTSVEDGLILDANQRYAELAGFSSAEALIGKRYSTEFYVESNDRRRMLAELRDKGEVNNFEMRLRQQNGTFRWALFSLRLNEEENCLEGVITDITDRKQAQEDLVTSLSLLQATFESIEDGILAVDREGKVISCNQKFLDLWKIPPELLFDQPKRLAYVSQQLKDSNSFLHKIQSLYADPAAESIDILELNDGRVLEQNTAPQRIGTRIVGRVWCLRDITDARRSEEALKASEARLNRILDSTVASISRFRSFGDGVLYPEYFSSGVQPILGFPPEALLANMNLLYDRIPTEEVEAFFEHLQAYIEAEQPATFEHRYFHPDGTLRWISVTFTALWEEAEQCWMVTGIAVDITDRKQAEEALKASEARLNAILQSTRASIGRYRQSGADDYVPEYYSPGSVWIWGYTPEELLEDVTRFTSRIHPEDLQRLHREAFADYISQGKMYEAQYRYHHPNGDWRWINLSLTPERDEERECWLTTVIATDVTDRRQVEEELKASETRLNAILNSAFAAIGRYRIYGDGHYEPDYYSPGSVAVWGYTPEELIEDFSRLSSRIDPEDWQVMNAEALEYCFAERCYEYIYRYHHPDGSLRWINIATSSQRDEVLNCWLATVIATDVTDRKRAEEALALSEAKFRTIVENANDLISTVTPDGIITYMSPNIAALTGYAVSELEGNYFAPFLHPDDVATCTQVLEQITMGENYAGIEFRHRCRDGSYRFFVANVSKIQDDRGNPLILGISHDITERKRNEQQILQQQALLRTVIDTDPNPIFVKDWEGRYLLANKAAAEFYGLTVEEVLGKRDADLHPEPTVVEEFVRENRQVIETGQELFIPEERVALSADREEWFQWQKRPLQMPGSDALSVLGIGVKITARKQIEQALRRSELKYRRLFETSQVGIFRSRLSDGLILDANQRFIRETGYDNADEVIGKHYTTEFYANLDERNHIIEHLRQHGEFNDFELQHRRRDGSLGWGLYSVRLNLEENCIEGVATFITERKQAEEALYLSELKYRSIFENSQVGIGRTRVADGLVLDINQRAATILGYDSPADLIGKQRTVDFFVNPEERQAVRDALRESGEVHDFEFMMRRGDGTTGWALLSLRLNQKEDCIESVIVDISDRKQLEEEVRQSQQFLDSLISNIPLALFVKEVNRDFRYVLVNQHSEKILGVTREQAIGRNDAELISPERFEFHRAEDRMVIEQGAIVEFPDKWVGTPGQEVIVRGWKMPLRNAQGQVTHLVGISEDVTDRRRREQALQFIVEGTAAETGNEFFQSCVRCLAEALGVRYALVAEFCNAARTRIRTLAIWGGTHWANIEYDLAGTPCEGVVTGAMRYYPCGIRALFPDDRDLVETGAESYMGVPLVDSAGTVLGLLAVMDVQPMQDDLGRELILKIFAARAGAELERNRAEDALRVAKEAAEAANRAKSAFLANMSHELRTPLNAILGFAQLMERDSALTARQRDSLATINRSGEHLLDLINDVLEMSKIEAGRTVLNPAPFDLHNLLYTLREMFQVRAEAKRLLLDFQIVGDLPQYIVTDEGKLRQVLINLLSNAVKFTEAGSVTLRVYWQSDELHYFEFEVSDTGLGIAPEEIDRLFEPFVQTMSGSQAREGTGLGLAISRQFVELMGGTISVISVPQQGSTFRFSIEATLAEECHVLPRAERGRVLRLADQQPKYRILIVDDRPENRDLITQLLSTVGFDTQTAANGVEAIAQWRTWQPDLIWMDMRMPVMNGYEATRRIRQLERDRGMSHVTKILALTASAFEEQRATILAAGCDDLVRKPFRESVIFEKMADHLGAQYLYATGEAIAPTVSQNSKPFSLEQSFTLNASSLAIMPSDWIDALNQAALEVDADRLLQLIQSIPEEHQLLAIELRKLIDRYCFDEILELTEAIN